MGDVEFYEEQKCGLITESKNMDETVSSHLNIKTNGK